MIELRNIDDLAFVGQLYIGSEGQQMEFVFDTGTVWLWLGVEGCDGCSEGKRSRQLFDTEASETYELMSDKHQMVGYGNGSAAGDVARDKICLKPIEDGEETAVNLLKSKE